MSEARLAIEARWLELTRCVLPRVAGGRGWPICLDHCFQRVLLDAVFGDVWYAHVRGRPAYRALSDAQLRRAVDLGEAVAAGRADLHAMNAASLQWRGKINRPQ